ncbi:membrane protein [Peptostreptococcus sp. MV1]|uniref:trimeric intracellular cation channel family protein n=1 Tax=Peptostreptococcus sp. MV1 TaxID=1219626 RepID=UPI0005103D87|nr:TRIC cation channel family protein [Peptostreptococcus sp. MV1]KGF12828.1 membrane protein [Peptostreptococcus sp. MV1]
MLIFAIEIVGTIAFAVSGSALAIKKQMDLLGVIVLGLTTAIGGGIIRDVIIGAIPPSSIQHTIYAKVSIATSLLVFLVAYIYRNRTIKYEFKLVYNNLLLVSDSIGLGLFTVVGINSAYHKLDSPGFFLLVLVGVVTGVGGGLVRDIMAGDKPYIFIRHIYASASILGAVSCIYLWDITGKNIAMLFGTAVVFLIRFLAARFKLDLPKIQGSNFK